MSDLPRYPGTSRTFKGWVSATLFQPTDTPVAGLTEDFFITSIACSNPSGAPANLELGCETFDELTGFGAVASFCSIDVAAGAGHTAALQELVHLLPMERDPVSNLVGVRWPAGRTLQLATADAGPVYVIVSGFDLEAA